MPEHRAKNWNFSTFYVVGFYIYLNIDERLR